MLFSAVILILVLGNLLKTNEDFTVVDLILRRSPDAECIRLFTWSAVLLFLYEAILRIGHLLVELLVEDSTDEEHLIGEAEKLSGFRLLGVIGSGY